MNLFIMFIMVVMLLSMIGTVQGLVLGSQSFEKNDEVGREAMRNNTGLQQWLHRGKGWWMLYTKNESLQQPIIKEGSDIDSIWYSNRHSNNEVNNEILQEEHNLTGRTHFNKSSVMTRVAHKSKLNITPAQSNSEQEKKIKKNSQKKHSQKNIYQKANKGKTPAQITLHWLLHQNLVLTPKASSVRHLHRNIAVLDFTLIAEENKIISKRG